MLYHELEEPFESAAYHRRCVEISQRVGKPLGEYSKSMFYVAEYERSRGKEGDWGLAREYLDRLANSNVEEVTQATELLRKMRTEMIS
jgi:anaphase-promoting complex subunit 8